MGALLRLVIGPGETGEMRARRSTLFWIGLGCLGAIGAASLLAATRWGVGVGYDSIFYLSAADNLLKGLGFSRFGGGGAAIPLTHYPPLYPIMLATGSWVSGQPVVQVARVVAVLMYAALIVISCLIVKDFTKSWWAGLSAAALLLVSPTFLNVDAWAMSEGLYLVCMAGGLWILARYSSSERWASLVGSAGVVAAAYATRYVAGSLIATGIIVIFWVHRRAWRSGLRRSAVFAVISGTPVLSWMVHNALLTGDTTNRTLVFHWLTRGKVAEAGHALADFILPGAWPFRLRLGLMLFVLVGMAFYWIWTWRSETRSDGDGTSRGSHLAAVLSLHASLYTGMVLVSLLLFDASTRLNERILSPLLLLFLLMIVLTLWSGIRSMGSPMWGRALVVLALVGGLLSQGGMTLKQIRAAHTDGLGFNARHWVLSPTVAWIRSLPPNAVLVSNESFPIYFLTGRPAYGVPERLDPVKGQIRQDFPNALEAMRGQLEKPDAYLVVFHPDSLRVELPPLDVLAQGLQVRLKTGDAIVYTPGP